METKNKSKIAKRILNKCGFKKYGYSGATKSIRWSLSGGLAFAWNDVYDVSLIKMTKFFMHFVILDPIMNLNWNMVLLYLSCVDNVMNGQFTFLIDYCSTLHGLIFCVGDFNTFLKAGEKLGGNPSLDAKVYMSSILWIVSILWISDLKVPL